MRNVSFRIVRDDSKSHNPSQKLIIGHLRVIPLKYSKNAFKVIHLSSENQLLSIIYLYCRQLGD
mgnify:FL=1